MQRDDVVCMCRRKLFFDGEHATFARRCSTSSSGGGSGGGGCSALSTSVGAPCNFSCAGCACTVHLHINIHSWQGACDAPQASRRNQAIKFDPTIRGRRR